MFGEDDFDNALGRMTPKEWLALFAFYAAYLFFGSSVFYHNEHALETERRAEKLAERIEMNGKDGDSKEVH